MDEDRVATGHVHATMRIAVLCVAGVVQFGLCLRQLFEYDHHPAWLAAAAFTALAAVTAVCAVWVVRRRAVPGAVAVTGAVVVLAASVAATAAVAPDARFQPEDWSFGLVGWHLLLLLLDRVPVLLTALAAHLAASVVQFLLAGVPDRAEVGAAGTVALGTAVVQLAVVVITRMLVRRTAEAVAVAAERDRLTTRLLVAQQWERDQRSVFAGQLGVTLPLLADLADGVLDPREEGTRRRCALAATQLRRLFAENDEVPDPLVHEVAACADVAERRGVEVSLAVSGAAVEVPPDVRRELTGPVAATLSAASGRARVSVLRTDDDVRVAVVVDTVVDTVVDAVVDTVVGAGADVVATSTARVEVGCGTYGGHLRMEARWRRRNS